VQKPNRSRGLSKGSPRLINLFIDYRKPYRSKCKTARSSSSSGVRRTGSSAGFNCWRSGAREAQVRHGTEREVRGVLDGVLTGVGYEGRRPKSDAWRTTVVGLVSRAVTAHQQSSSDGKQRRRYSSALRFSWRRHFPPAAGDHGESARTGGASTQLCGGALHERRRGNVGRWQG
jgi:hypothetical protein